MKRIVVALGGNALGNTPAEQHALVKHTAKSIAALIGAGNEVIVAHGNGPQVGMINLAFETASSANGKIPEMPFPECGAMSQGYIGYHLQNALRRELLEEGLKSDVATIITQVVVDEHDAAFLNPTKPIGSFYNQEVAKELEESKGYIMKEDAGRGYRRVVASPKPIDVVELNMIKTLVEANHCVITVGGGGIPVIQKGHELIGVAAVIDKDFASAKLAELLDADYLFILTAVEHVSIHYGKPNQINLTKLSVKEAREYIKEGHFAKGSMLPKVEAAIQFASSKKGRVAVIASLEKSKEALEGNSGTIVTV